MRFFLAVSLFAASVLAQTCGERGTSSAAVIATYPTKNDAYSCGLYCATTTACQGYLVGGSQGCQLVQGGFSSVTLNETSPYQFYQKYSCDYTTYRVTPVLNIPTPTPTGSVCQVVGWDKQNPGSFYAYTVAAYTTVGGCYLQCSDRGSSCAAFGVGNGQCLLYSTKLVNNILADPSSPYTYYDMNCFVIGSSSTSTAFVAPATSTSTTKTPTSTSSPNRASTTTTSTTTTAAASSANVCGVAGYDKQSPAAYRSDSTAVTQSTCSALCKSDATCKGYAVGGGICLLYASSVAANVNAVSNSPYFFYDAACSTGSSSSATTTLQTATRTSSSAAATSTAATCSLKGYETSDADASIVGFKFKPTGSCKSFCTGKSALSYEIYYDYCICFSKAAKSVASADSSSTVLFSDISC